MSQTYTVKQVAELLGYSTNSVYSFLKEGRIKGVRVGKGRFRILQEEINRLLHRDKLVLSQNQNNDSFTPSQKEIVDSPFIKLPKFQDDVSDARIEVPSLFDWFVGLSSIVLGFTMVLFTRQNEEFNTLVNLGLVNAIKVTFMAAGFGLLISDIVGKTYNRWRNFFYTVLMGAYASYNIISFKGQDLQVGVLYSLVFIAMFIHIIFRYHRVLSLAIYDVLIFVFMPPVIYLSNKSVLSDKFALLNSLPVGAMILIWLVISFFSIVIVWYGYNKHKLFFTLGMGIFSLSLFLLAFYYSTQLYWGRSLVLMMLALTSIFVPVWRDLKFEKKPDKKVVFGSFAVVLLIFIATVGLIWVLQVNLKDYASQELINENSHARLLIESYIQDAEKTIENVSKNSLFVKAVKENDKDNLAQLGKGFFATTSVFRRILVLDLKGNLLLIYPYGKLPYENLAFRDYFKQVIDTRKTYVSHVFDAAVDGQRLSVGVISSAILDEKNQLVGVFVGSVNFNNIEQLLGQIANEDKHKSFMLVDNDGVIIIGSEPNAIGTKINNFNSSDFNGIIKSGAADYTDANNIQSLRAHDRIDNLGWHLFLTQPLNDAISLSRKGSLVLLFFILIGGVIVTIYVFLFGKKTKTGEDLN